MFNSIDPLLVLCAFQVNDANYAYMRVSAEQTNLNLCPVTCTKAAWAPTTCRRAQTAQ